MLRTGAILRTDPGFATCVQKRRRSAKRRPPKISSDLRLVASNVNGEASPIVGGNREDPGVRDVFNGTSHVAHQSYANPFPNRVQPQASSQQSQDRSLERWLGSLQQARSPDLLRRLGRLMMPHVQLFVPQTLHSYAEVLDRASYLLWTTLKAMLNLLQLI